MSCAKNCFAYERGLGSLPLSMPTPFSIQPRSMLNKARGRHNFYANLLHVFNTFVATAVAVVVVY